MSHPESAPHLQSPADSVVIRELPLSRPLAWLALGWHDLVRAPGASLMHGLLVAAGGWLIVLFALRWWYLLPGAFSGFVLVGPILATGLYELSRRLAAGEPATLTAVFAAWRRGTRPLVWLGLGLALGGTLWVMFSAVLVALFVHSPIADFTAFVRHVVLSQGSNLFPLWLMAGGLGASIVFALTVISAPLLLDRDTDLATALLVSVRAVGANPVTMALWATIIMLVTALSVATAMLGFVIAIPLVGHATWHAYRDAVDAGALPARQH